MAFRKPERSDDWISNFIAVWEQYKASDGCDDIISGTVNQGWTPCLMPRGGLNQKCNFYGTKNCPHGQGMIDLYWDGFNYVIKCCDDKGIVIGHKEGTPETCSKCGVVIDWDGIPMAMPTITPEEDQYDVEEQVIKEIRDRMGDDNESLE